jgi:tetratricopeptide (TPR) repeat protein
MSLISNALKTTRGLAQLGAAAAIGLLGVGLLLSTVLRRLQEQSYRAAATSLYRGEWSDARKGLLELKDARPNDAAVRVLLGHLTLAKADEKDPSNAYSQAITYYKEALELDPGRPSAAIGLAVARLRLADATTAAADRKSLQEEAARALEQANAGDSNLAADVQAVRAGVAMSRGAWQDAAGLLDEIKSKGLPARESLGSYYWHKALLGLMTRDPGAVDNARRAYLFWPTSDCARGLALALRMACADPAYPTKDGLDAPARAALAKRIVEQRLAGGPKSAPGYRYALSESDRGSIFNAIGIGLVSAGELEEAKNAFAVAVDKAPKDPVFRMNLAEAQRMICEKPDTKLRPFLNSAGAYEVAGDLIGDDPARTALRQMLYRNAAIMLQMGNALGKAHEPLDKALKSGLDPKEYHRDLGILFDRGHNGAGAIEHYKEAIRLGHPESFKMEVRIERLKKK